MADRHTPTLEQEALADLIGNGGYERHVRRVRRRNGQRRAALLAALSAILGDEVTVVGADAGLHVVVWLNRVPRTKEAVLIGRAWAGGSRRLPCRRLYARATAADLPPTVGLVMGYASLDEQAIERGVQALKEVIDSFPAREPTKTSEVTNIYQDAFESR